ncbi:hypothetical protein PABG_11441 [Paracoccidioides brasiliensis Pb03]|nr:hypothetical protein PABG_11441 [Paracoccidioides brasiliensis Pb03]
MEECRVAQNCVLMLAKQHGEAARAIENYKPDTAYFDIHAAPATAPNRAPGDVKPSWKWRTDMGGSQIVSQRNEYHQALSQVNFYMNQHNSRYGFLVTQSRTSRNPEAGRKRKS